MLANDMKKGQVGVLENGWRFEIADNKKGLTRMAKVYGIYTEIGSIYVHDIKSLRGADGMWERIEYTPAQEKQVANLKAMLDGLGF